VFLLITVSSVLQPELAAAFASKRELPFDYLPNTGSRGGQQQQQQYTGRAANAHAPARVVIAHSLASLDAQTADRYGNLSPAVVLAPLPSLAAGFARDLFQRYRNQPRSLILFTGARGRLFCVAVGGHDDTVVDLQIAAAYTRAAPPNSCCSWRWRARARYGRPLSPPTSTHTVAHTAAATRRSCRSRRR
jgi:hypothetical protein